MYGGVIIITYKVSIIGGNLRAGDDAQQAKFFDINELPTLAFFFQEDAVKQVIRHALSKKDKKLEVKK